MDKVYRVVGQLYVNSVLELEKIREQLTDSQERATQALAERDELLRLLAIDPEPAQDESSE